MKVTRQVEKVAIKTGKSKSTVWRWLKNGCDLSSPASIKQFLNGDRPRQTSSTVRNSNKENASAGSAADSLQSEFVPDLDLNSIELAPVGKRGAAAALQRLEEIEERAHARLMRAIEAGNPFQVKSAQEFYLRCSETLRRLDLAVETERRNSLEQIPLRQIQIESVSAQISTWLRLAFEQFLSAESPGLMGIKDLGEFKFSAIESFRGILHATVKASLRAASRPIPDWAAAQVMEGWNISGL